MAPAAEPDGPGFIGLAVIYPLPRNSRMVDDHYAAIRQAAGWAWRSEPAAPQAAIRKRVAEDPWAKRLTDN